MSWLTLTCFTCLLQTPSAEQMAFWAQRYAPIVVLDSRENAPLSSVDAALGPHSYLENRCDSKQRPVFSPEMLATQAQEIAPHCDMALNFKAYIPSAEAVAYYHITADSRYIYLQYWFFYSFNDTRSLGGGEWVRACGTHEGDWEHISLRLKRIALAEAQSTSEFKAAVDDVYFAQHKRHQYPERKYFRPSDSRLQWQGSQLKVYPALGSHASLPAPGDYPLLTVMGLPIRDSQDGKGLHLDLAQGRVLPLAEQKWAPYLGRWGGFKDDACQALEAISSASNDGVSSPHDPQQRPYYTQGDWFDVYRPSR